MALAVPEMLKAAVGVFTFTAFVSACLLFLVQPMFAKLILPQLGGSPAVWNICVLFFQTTLLLGYAYAHFTTKWLGIRRQVVCHLVVLLTPALFLPLTLGPSDVGAGGHPVSWLLATMASTVGVPFFVVSASAPLVQRWFGALPIASARDPYFLYSASNLGSIMALLGYPFVIEPAIGLHDQTRIWAIGYAILVVITGACIWLVRKIAPVHAQDVREDAARPPIPRLTARQRWEWIVFSFVPSSLMLGVTTYSSTDIAAVPLLWVVPLAIYLLTFVLAFSPRQFVPARSMATILPVLIVAALCAILLETARLLPLHLVTFFCISMVCHGRLADRRPHISHLTEFYLWLSVGGVLGGVFNSLVAPRIFPVILEYPLLLGIAALLSDSSPLKKDRPIPARWVALTAAAVLVCIATWALGLTSVDVGRILLSIAIGVSTPLIVNRWGWAGAVRAGSFLMVGVVAYAAMGTTALGTVLFVGRSFFGVLRIVEAHDHTNRMLVHGTTIHGWQAVPNDGVCEPNAYYGVAGPIGQLLRPSTGRFANVAVLGLGTGVLACYAEKGQHWTFYEIDAMVEQIARNPTYFTHLRNSPGNVNVVLGDGRITLNKAAPGQYDLIVLDAFSSDAIPVHLLTREAFELYFSRLKTGGVIAVHISNRYLNLEPLIGALAHQEGMVALANLDKSPHRASHWVMVARDRTSLASLEGRAGWRPATVNPAIRPWTDDYSNVLQVLAFR
jgi:hypothetical protein